MVKGNHGHIPIYQKLFEFYQKGILSQKFKPGSRIDSINRMMERHQVSRETAKRVLHMLIQEQLVVTKAGKGTFVRINSKKIRAWGVVVPFYSSNIEKLIVLLQHEAKNLGRSFQYYLHYNNADEEIRIVSTLIQSGLEAVIIVPNYNETQTSEFYRNLIPGHTKIVLADNTMAGSYFNYVIQSYDLGVKRVVDYLGEGTEGNFLLLNSEMWQGKNLVFDLVRDTFRVLVADKYYDRFLFVSNHINALTPDYLHENNITGVLSLSDTESIRLLGRLKLWGFKVPSDISVVSYGNTELTQYSTPAITAIDSNYPKMASDIAQQIVNKQKRQHNQVVLQPKLIIRHT